MNRFTLYIEKFDIEVEIDLSKFEENSDIIIHYEKEQLAVSEDELKKSVKEIIECSLKKGIDILKEKRYYCFDCINNWNNESCLNNGREIYSDSIACENYCEKEE